MALAWCGLANASAARADPPDTLGSTNSLHFPIPSPSFDATPRRFVVDGRAYRIPRNYVVTTESLPNGNLVNISIRALLPDLSAMTPETAHCFRDVRDPCNSLVLTIGIENGGPSNAAARLKTIAAISKPGIRQGPCGIDYYEAGGSLARGNSVFQFFFTTFPKDRAVSILRCVKTATPFAPVCDSNDNLGNGNAFYYVFDGTKLCAWGDIKAKVLGLIESFELAAKNE